jgi:integrase
MIGKGLGRTTINKYIDNIKRMFRWGAETEVVPPAVFHGLQAISGLRKGRCEAREYGPVKPVAEAFIEAVKDHVSDQVWAMIQLQVFTGMRPGEVVVMRGQDIDTTGKLWVYTPQHHKTEHHGIARAIYLGPKAKEVVQKFMKPELGAYLFDPRDAVEAFNAAKRKGRRTPMTPSQAKRTRKQEPKKQPLEHYTTESYRRAVARGCQKANQIAHKKDQDKPMGQVLVPQWHPHQLRHNAATRFRKEYGLDAARVVLGHRSAAVTEIYAEIDHSKAQDIMAVVG